MKILAIETSCDETAVAVLDISGPREKPEIKILGNQLYSQAHLHEEYGGVYPNLAKREHQKNLPILLEKALSESGIRNQESGIPEELDLIAVTRGPGLEPALWVGITFAEELGEKWGKPVVPVDHMEGHIFSVLYGRGETLQLPALALLVSGGHTELVSIQDFCQYEILGRTRDDAVGEAFDKVARILGLPYPGGPNISAMAEIHRKEGREDTIKFPRPMLHSGDLDFSYSGLKTAVLYKVKNLPELTDEDKRGVARAFEDSAVEVLVQKTKQALDQGRGEFKSLIVAGGVSGNTHLQRSLQEFMREYPEVELLVPDKELSTDNAVMIGIASYIRVSTHPEILTKTGEIRAQGNLALDN